jgi:hypothetical protein
MADDEKPPWKRKNPRKRSGKLTPEQKAFARASAQRAGRRYPNLVDNMRAANWRPRPAKRVRPDDADET